MVIAFCFGKVQAQDHFFSLALNASDITTLGYQTFQQPGLYANFGWSNNIEFLKDSRINHGFAYSMKGARKSPDPKNNDNTEYNVRLHYAEAFVQTWIKTKSIKVITGFNLGYLIQSTTTGTNSSFTSDPNFKKFDFSVTGGVGSLVGTRFFPQLSASYSIFPVKDMSGTGTLGFARGPRNIVFTIGCSILLLKKVDEDTENSME